MAKETKSVWITRDGPDGEYEFWAGEAPAWDDDAWDSPGLRPNYVSMCTELYERYMPEAFHLEGGPDSIIHATLTIEAEGKGDE